MQLPQIIETERLRLRPPEESDASLIFDAYARDPQVTRYLVWSPHHTLDDTRAFIERSISSRQQGESLPYVVTLRRDGRLIGMVELRPRGYSAALGYVFARQFWGQGYASEAVRAPVEWAIAQPSIYRVWAVCDVENLASARVLEKAGLQREGLLRRWIVHPNISNEPRDVWCYALVK